MATLLNFVMDLMPIVQRDDLDKFQMVVKEQGTVNIGCSEGSALQLSVRFLSFKIFNFIIDDPDALLDVASDIGDTPLTWCVLQYLDRQILPHQTHYIYFLLRLLEKGASVNVANVVGETPFIRACYTGDEECINLLLEYEVDLTTPTLSQWLLPFDVAARSLQCPEETLRVLFRRTFHGYQGVIQVHLSTVSAVIKCAYMNMLGDICRTVTELYIPSEYYVVSLVEQLHNLPFTFFLELLEFFPNLGDKMAQLHKLNICPLAQQSDDVAQYLTYFCQNCVKLRHFSVTALLAIKPKLSKELITKLVFIVLRHRRPLMVDLSDLYALYGFSPLFQKLLENDIRPEKKNKEPLYVPVFYNTTLETKPPYQIEKEFSDASLYFARQDQVPSLLQMSRDVTKKHFIKKYKVENSQEYAQLLENLPLCTPYKDILRYKQKMYL